MKRRLFALISVLAVTAMLVSACGGNGETQTPEQNPSSGKNEAQSGTGESGESQNGGKQTVRVGMVCGGMTPMLAQIGINDGSFANAGLQIEKKCFNSGSDAVQALVGGSIDINLGSYEHVLRLQNNQLDVKAYGEIYDGVGYSFVVKKDAPYQSLADLKGQTLAVTKAGSLSDTGLRLGLKEAGIDPDRDVRIIGAGSGSTMFAAIDSDKAAGGMVSEPTLSQMVHSGKYRVLYDPSYEYAGIVVVAKAEWVNSNKPLMQTFLKVLKEIHDRSQQDPKSAVDAMQKEFHQIPREVLEIAVQNQLKKVPEGLKITEKAAETVLQSQLDTGALKNEVPYEKAVDLSLLP